MKRHAKTPAPRSARLFAEHERPSDQSRDAHIAYVDGAARGNPGPASYGVVIRAPDGRPLAELRKYVGRTTNNVAEYYALIAALDYAFAHGISKLRVRSDSELLVRQMQGRYKVRSPDLRPLHERARKLSGGLAYFHIEHVPREQNREADALANETLDRTGDRAGSSDERGLHGKVLSAEEFKQEYMREPRRPAGPAGTQTRRIRARYSHGALHPLEPLDLPEGAEVELEIRKCSKH